MNILKINGEKKVVYDFANRDIEEIIVEDFASLDLQILCMEDFAEDLVLDLKIVLGSDAKCNVTQMFFGKKNAKVNLQNILKGNNSVSNIYTVYKAEGGQKYDFKIINNFCGYGNKGETVIKGIANGSSQVNVDGVIQIEKTGHSTDAKLSEHALILSHKATVRNLPILKIDTNDVKASHSASVSRINDEDIFYLESRGLDRKDGEEMLVEGFLNSVLERI